MDKNPICTLADFGQSAWLDNISRSLIKSGRLKSMIGQGLRGMTSNPTIFDKSISSSVEYDSDISFLCEQGKSVFEIYDELTVKDIQDAADIFLPVYRQSLCLDGYVSLEIDPRLAYKTQETILEGIRLHKKVNRPNVMLKVPATEAGFKAAEELTASGINLNITLIFSQDQYLSCVRAYLKGIERYISSGGDARGVRSVASVFVSRIDTVVDGLLEGLIKSAENQVPADESLGLRQKAAVANCAMIYANFLEIFSSPEFLKLFDKGANPQRVLWGSTSTKNPAYSDIKYVTELIAKNTVNTMPENTLKAFLDHGLVKEALTADTASYKDALKKLSHCGIDINRVCAKLLEDGLKAFENSFNSLLGSIEEKARVLCKK